MKRFSRIQCFLDSPVKSLLVVILSASPVLANSTLKELDEKALSEVKGQAKKGRTSIVVDFETKLEIGEFMYKDAGSLYVKGLRLGGHRNNGNSHQIDR